MLNQFSRTQLLLGEEAMEKLKNSRVAVFGIGGVGGYVCEALVRSGVGAFDLIDDDKVCLTNLNRQIIATRKTVFTIIFFLLCTAFPPPSFQYHAIPGPKMRASRDLPRHFCQKRSANHICNHMLLCRQCRDKHGKCRPEREPLIPARNLPSATDCDIAEPAVQAVNRWEQIVRRIHLVEQGKHMIPESLFRNRWPYVRCRQQQIKCHTDKPRQNICCKEPPDKFFLSACGNQIIYNPDQITAKINHDRPRDHRDLLVQHRFYVVMFPRTGKRPRSKISDKIRCQRQN